MQFYAPEVVIHGRMVPKTKWRPTVKNTFILSFLTVILRTKSPNNMIFFFNGQFYVLEAMKDDRIVSKKKRLVRKRKTLTFTLSSNIFDYFPSFSIILNHFGLFLIFSISLDRPHLFDLFQSFLIFLIFFDHFR